MHCLGIVSTRRNGHCALLKQYAGPLGRRSDKFIGAPCSSGGAQRATSTYCWASRNTVKQDRHRQYGIVVRRRRDHHALDTWFLLATQVDRGLGRLYGGAHCRSTWRSARSSDSMERHACEHGPARILNQAAAELSIRDRTDPAGGSRSRTSSSPPNPLIIST